MLGPSNRNLWLLYGSRTENDFLTDEYLTYEWVDPGEVLFVRETGFRYQVLADDATDEDLAVGEVKLRVLPGPDGSYNFNAWAPVGDGVSDDYLKLRRALDTIPVMSVLRIPGQYFIGQTVFFKKRLLMLGDHAGFRNSSSPPTLKFPLNTKGLKFEAENTFDGVIVEATTGTAGSAIRGIAIEGTRGTDKSAHGIHSVVKIEIDGCIVKNFSGNGIHIYAQVRHGGDESIYGNANYSRASNFSCEGNGGSGLFIKGEDANACYFHAGDLSQNGRWGLRDESFLGNTHIAHHTAQNGVAGISGNPAGSSSFVSYGGMRYSPVVTASEAALVATEPGTDSSVWANPREGGADVRIPLWEPGKSEGTYFHGGAYMIHQDNARGVLIGSYSEGNQAASSVSGPSVVLGGLHEAGFSLGGGIFGATDPFIRISGVKTLFSHNDTEVMIPGNGVGSAVSWRHPDAGQLRVGFDLNRSTSRKAWVFRFGSSDYRTSIVIPHELTDINYGRNAPVPYVVNLPSLALGRGPTSSPNQARIVEYGLAAPTTGHHARGEIVLNAEPVAGGNAGWACVAAGTPGTWKAFGAIDA